MYQSSAAPKSVALLPLAYLLHLAEEWFGGFTPWTAGVLGQEITTERFLLINSLFFIICLVGSAAALRWPRMSWLAVMFASLFGLNGLLHALATLGFGQYSPGVITGMVIYLPLAVVVMKTMKGRITAAAFNKSVGAGIMLHVLIFLLARI